MISLLYTELTRTYCHYHRIVRRFARLISNIVKYLMDFPLSGLNMVNPLKNISPSSTYVLKPP